MHAEMVGFLAAVPFGSNSALASASASICVICGLKLRANVMMAVRW
jgi:hypothetical protein